MKKILYEKEAREKLLKGSERIYLAVCTTLGPKGRNVCLPRPWSNVPLVVHDGVTVANDVEDEDEFIDAGIKLVRAAAQKTNEEAGDGTTTSTLLAYHLIDKGMKLIDEGKINAMVLRTQLEKAQTRVLAELGKITTTTEAMEDIERIAFISSADETVGKFVREAIEKVGKDGLVTVDSTPGTEVFVDYTEGMEFDKGYASPVFITNETRMEAVMKNPSIIVLKNKVTTQKEIMPILNQAVTSSKDFVIIGDVEGMALNIVTYNKFQGLFNALVVSPPGFMDRRESYLDDIALLTGATVVANETGQFTPQMMGKAEMVIASKNSTAVINGQGDKNTLAERIEQLKERRKLEESVYEREKIDERIAKLTTGAAVIKVGAKTEIEGREKLERVKDAVSAAKAALDEGVVPGGGTAFLRMSKVLDESDEGTKLLYEVLQEPLNKLLINSGETEERQGEIIEMITHPVRVETEPNAGYNVMTGDVEDLVKAGIIDPTKVIRLSLENAVSVAGSILSTDCLIVEKREVAPQLMPQE